jgi:protein-tyrosine phosphatase
MFWSFEWILFLIPYLSPLLVGGRLFYSYHFIISLINIIFALIYIIFGDAVMDNVTLKLGTVTVNFIALFIPSHSLIVFLYFWFPILIYFFITLGVPNADLVWQDETIEIYVGNFMAGRSISFLNKRNITRILEFYDKEGRKNPVHDHISHKQIYFMDRSESNLSNVTPASFSFLESGGEEKVTVLIHCSAGVSRSIAVATAFLIQKRGLSYSDALRRVRSARPLGDPNGGFKFQLMKMVKAQ